MAESMKDKDKLILIISVGLYDSATLDYRTKVLDSVDDYFNKKFDDTVKCIVVPSYEKPGTIEVKTIGELNTITKEELISYIIDFGDDLSNKNFRKDKE